MSGGVESDGGAWIENRTGSGGGECRKRKSERVHKNSGKGLKEKIEGVLMGFVLLRQSIFSSNPQILLLPYSKDNNRNSS